jgi:cob(I)alamin adenosyltransferase
MTGLVYIFTGTGKGKTSAALGMTVRAVCNGMKVAWVAWYKTASWGVSEFSIEENLKNVQMYVFGKGFYFDKEEGIEKVGNVKVAKTKVGTVVDQANANEHREAAQKALQKAKEILAEGKVDLLICDEFCQAVAQKLVSMEEAISFIESRGAVHLVLTGRDCPQELIEKADTVSTINPTKHAYDQGKMAVKGLDF